jgi:hypothetical protein
LTSLYFSSLRSLLINHIIWPVRTCYLYLLFGGLIQEKGQTTETVCFARLAWAGDCPRRMNNIIKNLTILHLTKSSSAMTIRDKNIRCYISINYYSKNLFSQIFFRLVLFFAHSFLRRNIFDRNKFQLLRRAWSPHSGARLSSQ